MNHHRPIRGGTVLIQGTGTGWDLVSWAKYGPAAIYGVDLFKFAEWPDIEEYIRQEYGVKVMFLQASLDELPIGDESIDIVASDAVFEHCQDVPSMLRETRRVLHNDGIVYAAYGPLWYSAGGDHFSGRGGNDTVYNHVRLDESEYLEYFESHRNPVEDFQSGGRYVELGLFSKLDTSQYIAEFTNAGFELDDLILEVTDEGITFKRRRPKWFEEMVSRGIASDDLLLKANLVLLRPRSDPLPPAGGEGNKR